MPFTDVLMSELLALVPAAEHHVGLMTTSPLLVHDPLTVEVVGPLYSRQSGMALQNGTYQNTRALQWFGLPKGTRIEALGVFDAPVNGNLLYAVRCGPHSFPNGGFYRIGIGGLVADPTSLTYVAPVTPTTQVTYADQTIVRSNQPAGCGDPFNYDMRYLAGATATVYVSISGSSITYGHDGGNDGFGSISPVVYYRNGTCWQILNAYGSGSGVTSHRHTQAWDPAWEYMGALLTRGYYNPGFNINDVRGDVTRLK